MQRKQAEMSLRRMMKSHDYFVHKWRDRGFISCPTCHELIQKCPRCGGSMLLAKAQTYPDFLVASKWAFVECKQGGSTWSLWDVSEIQTEVLNNPDQSGWIFLELGLGKAPLGKVAFLIEWGMFKKTRDQIRQEGFKSVGWKPTPRSRIPTASDVFSQFQLQWITRVGWDIPKEHPWWMYFWSQNGSDTNPNPAPPKQLTFLGQGE